MFETAWRAMRLAPLPESSNVRARSGIANHGCVWKKGDGLKVCEMGERGVGLAEVGD